MISKLHPPSYAMFLSYWSPVHIGIHALDACDGVRSHMPGGGLYGGRRYIPMLIYMQRPPRPLVAPPHPASPISPTCVFCLSALGAFSSPLSLFSIFSFSLPPFAPRHLAVPSRLFCRLLFLSCLLLLHLSHSAFILTLSLCASLF